MGVIVLTRFSAGKAARCIQTSSRRTDGAQSPLRRPRIYTAIGLSAATSGVEYPFHAALERHLLVLSEILGVSYIWIEITCIKSATQAQ
jgi:hypothetical protein